MNRPVLVGPDMDTIRAYRAAHPESRGWPHVTPRSTSGTRGYTISEVRVVAPVTITAEMFASIRAGMLAAGRS